MEKKHETSSDRGRPSFEELERRVEERQRVLDDQNARSLKSVLETNDTIRRRDEAAIADIEFRHDLALRDEEREIIRQRTYLEEVERNRGFNERNVEALEKIADALAGIRDQSK